MAPDRSASPCSPNRSCRAIPTMAASSNKGKEGCNTLAHVVVKEGAYSPSCWRCCAKEHDVHGSYHHLQLLFSSSRHPFVLLVATSRLLTTVRDLEEVKRDKGGRREREE
uniref:Uncharacterized protein n=1 Tax=Oryza nivara TaxID=4536 RepID=A0A0E0G5R9_ORYNI